jgi:hypothetical protein
VNNKNLLFAAYLNFNNPPTPKEQPGGTFEIIFNAKDGQVIRLYHGK